MAFEFLNYFKTKEDTGYKQELSHKTRQRLLANLETLAKTHLKGQVVSMCVEVSPDELPIFLDVLSMDRVQNLLVFQQLEEPTQFVFAFREVEL